MKNTYQFKSKIWIHKGNSPWHFVTIDEDISKDIKTNLLFKPKGFRSVPVEIKVGKTIRKTSIFPHRNKTYLLPIKREIRQKENLNTNIFYKFTLTTLT